MSDAFTMFPKFGDAIAALPEEDRRSLSYAIVAYGCWGEQVELPPHLAGMFILMREDIDNSKDARDRGSKGGRPRRKPEVSANAKPEVSEHEKPEVSEHEKPEVSANAKPEVSEQEKPEVSENRVKTETHTNPYQSIPIHTKEKKRGCAFSHPSVDEVRDYCIEKGYLFDPEAFVAYYESNGWKVGRNPMKSWRAACATWAKRDSPKEEVRPDYAVYDHGFD